MRVAAALSMVALSSCADLETPPQATAGTAPVCEERGATFLAMTPDFEDFTSWARVDLPRSGGDGTSHDSGARAVYVSCTPPPSSTTYPVGARIVKVAQAARQPSEWQIFAMAKRGGGYNEGGAVGWEWFELSRSNDGRTAIAWRGLGPPDGEAYNQAGTTCNACHGASREHDAVMTGQLWPGGGVP